MSRNFLLSKTELLKRAQDDAARRTAESIFKIVQFVFYRVPPKDRAKFISRLRGKVLKINPAELGAKQMPPSSSIGQSAGFVKNLLSGLNPAFVARVLSELTRLLGASPGLATRYSSLQLSKRASIVEDEKLEGAESPEEMYDFSYLDQQPVETADDPDIYNILETLANNGSVRLPDYMEISDFEDDHENITKFLRIKLPDDVVVDFNENTNILSLVRRKLNLQPGRWLHVVNVEVPSLKEYLSDFKEIQGEVAFSEPQDMVFYEEQYVSDFLAIVVDGVAKAVFNKDVGSSVDPFTGRRIWHPQPYDATKRTEAWVVPAESKIVLIVTNSKHFASEAKEMGIDVVWSGAESLSRGTFKEEETEEERSQEELWEKSAPFGEGWAFDISARARPNLSVRAGKYVKKKKEESGNITYMYSKKHIEERGKKKTNKLKKLNKSLSKLRTQVRKDLKHSDSRIKYIALAIALIDETYARVGNSTSAKERGHYGVTTWLAKHVKFSGGKATIKYTGKSGVKQEKTVSEKAVLAVLKEACKGKKPNDRVFDGEDYYVNDNYINLYLRDFDITAKDIRGLHANEEMRKALKKVRSGKLPSPGTDRDKKLKEEFKEALEIASKVVGHEPSTLKNQYLIPTLEPDYLNDGRIGTLASNNFMISKRASLKSIARRVIIEPPDKEVEKAVARMDSINNKDTFGNVDKIVVHPGGSGHLGHVESGPGKNPKEIHIYKDRIKQIITQQMGSQQADSEALAEAIEIALMETLAHEVGHIGEPRTQEQILQQPFHGEPEAERVQREFKQKIPISKREQEAMDAITPTPTNPDYALLEEYVPWHSEIGNNPYGIMSIPLGIGGGGR